MKKFIILALLGLFVAGCGQSALRSEFWQRDSVYKNWDHMKYSWFGYRNQTAEDVSKSKEQGWWGIDVPYVPGEQAPSQ
ncbi:MAG: hypothetical protein PVH87_14065 [Desulfobacteraceae bacterium]|jgi:hypothetical protein